MAGSVSAIICSVVRALVASAWLCQSRVNRAAEFANLGLSICTNEQDAPRLRHGHDVVGGPLGRSLQDLVGFLSDLHAYGIDLFLQCAGSRYPVTKRRQSLPDIAAELETRGHLTERGKRSRRRASRRCWPDEVAAFWLLKTEDWHARAMLASRLGLTANQLNEKQFYRQGFRCAFLRHYCSRPWRLRSGLEQSTFSQPAWPRSWGNGKQALIARPFG
jgi:hypothetical protein